ncbi:hypothetical protein HNR25_003477 [Streptomonospora salina]|uniref:RloB-like protein n=1 Tax=Streptomonospora salina TaxID=104205 RepID=A0A841E9P0_9ACTN|nr:hypothetical protein [Streptomonospora salina]
MVTEIEYLGGLKRLLKSRPVEVVDMGIGRDPRSLVNRAIQERDKAEKYAQRENDENRRFDDTWVLLDVDEHSNLSEALRIADRGGINIALSNPCLELWLLYHYCDYTTTVHRQVLCTEKLPKYISGYKKHLPADFPFEAHPEAKKRAIRAAKGHDSPRIEHRNPSTDVWKLVEAIEKAGQTGPASGGSASGKGRRA